MKRTKICAIFTIFFAIASTIAYSSQTMSYNENSNKINAIAVANEPVNTSEVIYRAVVLPQEINEDFDILTPCGYTQTQLEQAMQGEYYKEMLPYVNIIVKAEETYGVNALYLLCKLGLESGWGKYMAAENNIGGWTNYYGGFKDFESVEDCVMHIADNLSNVYKNEVGTRLEDVCNRYCSDDGYLKTLMQIMIECEERINNQGE